MAGKITRYRDAFLGSLVIAIVTMAGFLIYLLAFKSNIPDLAESEWGTSRKTKGSERQYDGFVTLRFEDGGHLTYKKRGSHVAAGTYRTGKGNEAALELTPQPGNSKSDVPTRDGKPRPIDSARKIVVDEGILSVVFSDGAIADFMPLSKTLADLSDRQRRHLDLVAGGNFMEPATAGQSASYAFVSGVGEYGVLRGKSYQFDAVGFNIFHRDSNLSVGIRDWDESNLGVSFGAGDFKSLGVGRYEAMASNLPSSPAPTMSVSCGSRTTGDKPGEFVIWEFAVDPTSRKVTALAVDFVLRQGPATRAFGAIRVNSKFE